MPPLPPNYLPKPSKEASVPPPDSPPQEPGFQPSMEEVTAQEATRATTRLNPQEDWQKTLPWRYGRDGEVRGLKSASTVAMQILRKAPEWQGVLAFDEVAHGPCFLQAPPFPRWFEAPGPFPRMLGELDYTMLRSYFEVVWEFSLGKAKTFFAVDMAAKKTPIHPVRDYLRSVRWDGVARVGSWLSTYLGGKSSQNGSKADVDWAGQMWLISAVARAFHPGCRVDYVLVLEGWQRFEKSMVLQVLGGKFASNTPLWLRGRKASDSWQGKWIVELSVAEDLLRTDTLATKRFFAERTYRCRPPYAKRSIEVPRSCVFAGTTDDGGYIKDRSGSRRYWLVFCTQIELESLARDRDQLWAEAVALYEQGVLWYPQGEALSA